MDEETRVEFRDLIGGLRTIEDLRVVDSLLRRQWSRVSEDQLDAFNVGDKVSWPSRRGGIRTGTILKKNRKTVSVDEDITNVPWRVAASLLSRVVE